MVESVFLVIVIGVRQELVKRMLVVKAFQITHQQLSLEQNAAGNIRNSLIGLMLDRDSFIYVEFGQQMKVGSFGVETKRQRSNRK